jgi:AcrR family transcriptional regulator
MTAAPVHPGPAGDQKSLRERKKHETRRTLRSIALRLVAERGYCNVTVEDIAEAAVVSPRTFFNYFPSKEAVIVGADPERVEALRLRILGQPDGVAPLETLCCALREEAVELARDLEDLGGNPLEWVALMKSAFRDPDLNAARAAHMAVFEGAVADALAERLGENSAAGRSPYVSLLASTGMGVMRAAMSTWARTGGSVPLDELVGSAFGAVARGLTTRWEPGPGPGRLPEKALHENVPHERVFAGQAAAADEKVEAVK